jgi:hypothetical protein
MTKPFPLLLLPLIALAGCAGSPASTAGGATPNDPDARTFSGTIISLRFTTSTMLISKDDKAGRVAIPNIITVRYDAHTQFFLDGAPTTLDKLDRYMPVTIQGHMRDGQLFAESARFSSALPRGVKPSAVEPGPQPVGSPAAPPAPQ